MPQGPFQFGLINDTVCAAVGERTAILQGDRRVTYAELGSRTRKLARVFLEAGLTCHGDPSRTEPWESVQDHVGVLSLNRPEFVEAYLAAFKSRAAPFNINYRYTAAEIAQLLRDADAKALVYEGRFGPVAAEATAGLELKLLLRIEDGSGEEPLPGSVDFEEAVAGQDDAPLDLDYSDDEIYLVFTGGTTGMPKGVIWGQRDLFLHALTGQLPDEPRPQSLEDVAERARTEAPRVSVVCPPLMHGAGNWASLILLNQGGTVVYTDNPERLGDGHAICRAAEQSKAMMLQFTGDAFAIPIVQALREGEYDLSNVFVISTQAVALTPKVRQAIHDLLPNAMVIESYGTSEGGFQGLRIGTAADTDVSEPSKFGAVNQTVILDETRSRVLDPSEEGVIGWIGRSGRHQRGYYNDREKTEATFASVDGVRYLVTGDRAHYRADGQIQFLGREAVCINTGGEKVFGEEVEAVLKTHPAVRDAIVVGTPDERFGQRVTAVVSTDGEVTDDELDAHCRESLAGYKVPRTYVRVDEVPRLANGKPDYDGAREAAKERT